MEKNEWHSLAEMRGNMSSTSPRPAGLRAGELHADAAELARLTTARPGQIQPWVSRLAIQQVIEPRFESFSCTVFCRRRAAGSAKSTRSIS